MHAMILAAGRGERMRPLTDDTPKPLLRVGGEALIVRHVRRLTAAGFSPIIINLHHLGAQIAELLGDGGAYNTIIHYSSEKRLFAAAGGVRLAMARGLLPAPFALVNADVYCNFDFRCLHNAPTTGAHLIMVKNPAHKPDGDFSLRDGKLHRADADARTYAGIGVFNPALFTGLPPQTPQELRPLLLRAIDTNTATGEEFNGAWRDIGTPAALATAQRELEAGKMENMTCPSPTPK